MYNWFPKQPFLVDLLDGKWQVGTPSFPNGFGTDSLSSGTKASLLVLAMLVLNKQFGSFFGQPTHWK